MAEARSGGAPRANRTVKDFKGMHTQNERVAIPEGYFAWLENVQPIGQGNLHSIPGRGLELTRIPPLEPNECPDAEPGPQDLPRVCCYNSNGFGDLGGNDAGMFAFVCDSGDFWHTASVMSGFGSGPYPDAVPTKTWYLLKPQDPTDTSSPFNCALVEDTPLALPGGRTANFASTQTPQAGICGKSDEKLYFLAMSSISPPVWPIANGPGFIGFPGNDNGIFIFGENVGVNVCYASDNSGPNLNNWFCKFDDMFYCKIDDGTVQVAGFPLGNHFTYETIRVSYSIMFPGWNNGTFDSQGGLSMMHATQNFLYTLIRGPFGGGPNTTRLFKNLRSDLSYVTDWDLSVDPNFPNPWGLHVFSDDLIFFAQRDGDGNTTVGKFNTSSAISTVIGTCDTPTCTPAGSPVGTPGQSGFVYAMNYFYFSYSGFGLGVTNVAKYGPLVCPSDPSIPWQSSFTSPP